MKAVSIHSFHIFDTFYFSQHTSHCYEKKAVFHLLSPFVCTRHKAKLGTDCFFTQADPLSRLKESFYFGFPTYKSRLCKQKRSSTHFLSLFSYGMRRKWVLTASMLRRILSPPKRKLFLFLVMFPEFFFRRCNRRRTSG